MGIPAKKPVPDQDDDNLVQLSLESDPAAPELSTHPSRLGPRLSPSPASAAELDLWKDVFVERPLPWSRFLQSTVLHLTAAALIWGMSIFWLRNQQILAPSQFDKSAVLTYAPNEYLPPLDTGKAAAAPPEQKEKGELALAKQPILSVPR